MATSEYGGDELHLTQHYRFGARKVSHDVGPKKSGHEVGAITSIRQALSP